MSNLWNTYNSEFQITLKRTRELLSQKQTITKESVKTIESLKFDLENLLKNLDLESGNSQEERNLLREYKNILRNEINVEYEELLAEHKRRELLGDGREYTPYKDDDMTDSLLNKNSQLLSETGNRLNNINDIVNDTTLVGNDILMNLKQQRETLENSRQTLYNSNTYIDNSMVTLKSMSRRLIANKYISYCIIVVLILMILLVLYNKF
ncbi:related to t-SNARE VTI1 [Hanseniaspora guilliermondii]|uniref:Related to t-SNARE VTI1 n=1 Tax=Hanseniaspora guilliermondii TaxID=56406 RepID=A0A1L0AVL3_9ASCO|nr:related to t-SNARE VTI1 [Hanseniaspora guilliermondii]